MKSSEYDPLGLGSRRPRDHHPDLSTSFTRIRHSPSDTFPAQPQLFIITESIQLSVFASDRIDLFFGRVCRRGGRLSWSVERGSGRLERKCEAVVERHGDEASFPGRVCSECVASYGL